MSLAIFLEITQLSFPKIQLFPLMFLLLYSTDKVYPVLDFPGPLTF